MMNSKIEKIINGDTPVKEREELVNSMTDQEIEELYAMTQTDEGDKMKDLPSNSPILKMPSEDYVKSINESKKEFEGKTIPMNVRVDPSTGLPNMHNPIRVADTEITLDDVFENGVEDISTDMLKPMGELFGMEREMSDMDAMETLEFIKRVSKSKPISMFAELPQFMKNLIIDSAPAATPKQREEFAINLYNVIQLELKESQSFLELDELISGVHDEIPEMLDMYLDHIRHTMEVKMLEGIESIEEGSKDKAEKIRGMSAAFTDSYTYETIQNKIRNKQRIINKELEKEIKNYNKYCAKFNAAYLSSKWVIPDIKGVLYILDRKLPKEINIDSIKKFIILFCKISRKKTVSNIVDHSYMYYTVKLIESLDHITSPKSSMHDTILNNVAATIHLLEGNIELYDHYKSIVIEPTRIDEIYENMDLSEEDLDDEEINIED